MVCGLEGDIDETAPVEAAVRVDALPSGRIGAHRGVGGVQRDGKHVYRGRASEVLKLQSEAPRPRREGHAGLSVPQEGGGSASRFDPVEE